MRVLLWHGWFLEGSGSNVATAKTAEALVSAGHDVVVLCQESHPERFRFARAAGSVGPYGVGGMRGFERTGDVGSRGAVLLRPDMGSLLPVFVVDEYPGFTVKRFVDLKDAELEAYLDNNARALRVAVQWHHSDAVVAGHVIPGAPIALRAMGPGSFVVQTHGSDIEYTMREDRRFVTMAAEALEGARAVAGSSGDVLRRLEALVPSIAGRTRAIPPGVDAARFRPLSRATALETAAGLLEAIPAAQLGDLPAGVGAGYRSSGLGPRRSSVDEDVWKAMEARDPDAVEAAGRSYDQAFPDHAAADRLRGLAGFTGPLVGYLGKFIPQKGVHHLLMAADLLPGDVRTLVIGFGLEREWLTALTFALDRGDREAASWVLQMGRMQDGSPKALEPTGGVGERIAFTGRLDHRFAPFAVAGMDVLVVPSILEEAFGMVTAEGAAAGALPLVARHSGLAEVAGAIESAVGRPGLFSFDPGPEAPAAIAHGVSTILAVPPAEREALRQEVSAFARRTWTWDRTARETLSLFEG